MPGIVIKPVPDENFYIIWSTVVDNVTFLGEREHVIAHLCSRGDANDEVQDRLVRADANGTSAMWPETGPDAYGGWNDDGFIVHNMKHFDTARWLPRELLYSYCERIVEGEDLHAEMLTEALSDEE